MLRPRYRSAMARRVFLAIAICLCFFATLLLSIAALSNGVLADPSRLLPAWFAANVTLAVAAWPLLLAAFALALLGAVLLARWAVLPIDRLAAAAATLTDDPSTRLPTQAVGEVGAIARNFSDLSDLLIRSSHELEKQNALMNTSINRLEKLMHLSHELSLMLEADQLLRRAANALHDLLGYERAGAALIDGEYLTFYFSASSSAKDAAPIRVLVQENSVAGRAALTGATVRIDDLRRLAGSPGMPTARAELAVPVIHARQVLAVLTVQTSSSGSFGPQDEEQLAMLAQMLAGALATSSRFQDEQLRRQMAEAIYRVSQTLSSALDSARVPELVLDQLTQVLPFDRSTLLLIDGESVETVAARGYDREAIVSRRRALVRDLPLLVEVVSAGRPLALSAAAHDERYRPTVGAAPAQSWLGAPLLRFGQVIGVLVLESDQPDRYGREEQTAMMAIATQAAIALENARLYTEAHDRAQRLEVITELTTLVSTRDVLRELQSILRTAIHRMRRVVPCDYATLALFNPDDNTFTVETVYDYAVRDWADLAAGVRVPAADTPWQVACRTAVPLLQSDVRLSMFETDRRLATSGLQSSIVVPILGAKQAVGALMFASRDQGVYDQVQVATLMELAHYLGPALYNARLNREREATADQLAQTQEYLNLVDKVRVVGQLASGVAHDFNNLLAGILGNAQLLLYEIEDADQRDMLRVIERAAKDGSETVRRLQGFARMEHDSPMTEVRLDMLARDAIDITRPRWRDIAQSRGASIEIIRELQPVTPIAGRPAELREVITNLIINAVDALPEGGAITLASFDDFASDGPSSVVLEISDSGVGMSSEVQTRIFEPFFTTKGEQGTGLGLAVSLGIIQSHGGQISLESRLGQGTRFSVRLPVRVAETSDQQTPTSDAPITPGHLLLIESESMIRESLTRLLTRWGHRVTQATGGIEALRMFQPELFDLVLSDQGMPDMSGWDLIAEIKRREPRVPTVLMTGWGHQFVEEELRERGIDFVIEKPFDQDDLRQTLAKAMVGMPRHP